MSELAQYAQHAHTDPITGNSLNGDGSVYTQAHAAKSFPANGFGDLGELLQWQLDVYPDWSGQIYVDGTKYGEPGPEATAIRLSSRTGRLTLDGQAPPLVAPAPILLPPVITQPTTYNIAWPAKGQVRPKSNGLLNSSVTFKVDVPKGMPAHDVNKVAFIRLAEVPGSTVIPRAVIFAVNGKTVHTDNAGNTAPSAAYTLGNPTGYEALSAQFNVNDGDTLEVTVSNPGYTGLYGAADVLFDFQTPNRIDLTD